MRYHKAREDKKTKELQIEDHKKKYQEMQIKYVQIMLHIEPLKFCYINSFVANFLRNLFSKNHINS